MSRNAPPEWKLEYFQRIKDLIDNYHPDLLYTDGGIPFGDLGYKLVSHFYNVNAKLHGGKVQGNHEMDGSEQRSDLRRPAMEDSRGWARV